MCARVSPGGRAEWNEGYTLYVIPIYSLCALFVVALS